MTSIRQKKYAFECKRKNNAIAFEADKATPGFLKLKKDNLNVPSEFCMKSQLIRGSLEQKVYLDPSNLYLFVNRENLHLPVMEFPSRIRKNSEPSSPFKKPVVPLLKLKENPEDKLREIRAMSRQILQNKEVSESSLSSSVQNSKDSESYDEEESE